MSRHVIEVREISGGKTSRTQTGVRKATSNKTSRVKVDTLNVKKGYREVTKAKLIKTITAEVSLSQINNTVGSYTTNTIATRRRNVGLTYAGLLIASVQAPILGVPALVGYTAFKAVDYGIQVHNMNVSSAFLLDLSGGTINMSRKSGLGV